MLSGTPGIRSLSRFDASQFSSRIAGEVRDFSPAEHINPKEIRQMDLFVQYGVAAGIQAVTDAGLTDQEDDWQRIGIAVGSGIGGLATIENIAETYRLKGPGRMSPFFIPATIINMISGRLSILYRFGGPNVSLVSACTTGCHCIGDSFRMIAHGDADVMVCGGAEAAITPLGLGGFSASRALSTRNDEPERASRPFDSERDGFVLGEGAGVMVLEERDRAVRRGAKIYAEIVGYGMSADCHHITAPLDDGSGAARCMKNTLDDAALNPDEINYINAHGTSTPLGDIAETRAIKKIFGAAAAQIPVSSTKSMTGHLLGAAGGIEAVFTILAVREQTLPPTINLENPDPECDLDYVPNTARQAKVKAAMTNSFGFGGTNASLIFSHLLIRPRG